MAQLEAIRDQWLSPLVDRIESLAREATAERARADSAERERDELRQRVAELEPVMDLG